MTKRVYLDSNQWIKLSRISTGKETDPEYKKIYHKICSLSDSEQVIFPISMSHIHELTTHPNQQKREKMIDLLVDISKGWFLQPVDLFFDKEIENAIRRKLKQAPKYDIKNEIIKKGLSYFAGMDFEKFIKTKNPPLWMMDILRISFKDFNEDIEVIRRNLKDPAIVKTSLDALKAASELNLKLEKNRENRNKLAKDLRKRFFQVDSIRDLIIPRIAEFVYVNGLDSTDVFSSSTSSKEISSFVEDMPALNVFIKLVYERDEVSPQRKIQPSDHWDLVHFSGAIPYCDVLVTEKMFAGLSKKNNLDKKYNCIILTDLKELQDLEFFGDT